MKTLPQVFFESRQRPADHKALLFKYHGEWKSFSWKQYFDLAEGFAHHLINVGVKSGDRVAIFSETRYEWAISDMAVQCLGAITVPVYANGNAEELEHVLEDSGAEILLIDSKTQVAKWESIKEHFPKVREILVFDNGSWQKAVDSGCRLSSSQPEEIPKRISQSKIDDIATIVYTSGTSGLPKGVVLTQRQIMSEVSDIVKVFKVDHRDQTLCFLPYAHVLGRVEMWLSIFAGYTLGFAESIDRIRNNLMEIPPTVMISVPRIFEKIYAAVANQIDRRPFISGMFGILSRVNHGASTWLKGKLLARQMRAAFGGRMRFAISGGAPLDREIGLFFRAAGIQIYEGYGLTETTGAITVNTPEHHRAGSVGQPLPDVQIRIAADGELLIKSDKVMTKYYSLSESPLSPDGFFPSGDIGHLENGFLFITDRKKDLIKTSGGKYVAPQKLENALKNNPLISQVLIHGDKEKYIVALITLNKPELSKDPVTRAAVAKTVNDVNGGLSNYETIKKFAILDHDFTIAAGEVTPSLKLKRKFCEEKYIKEIQALYRST